MKHLHLVPFLLLAALSGAPLEAADDDAVSSATDVLPAMLQRRGRTAERLDRRPGWEALQAGWTHPLTDLGLSDPLSLFTWADQVGLRLDRLEGGPEAEWFRLLRELGGRPLERPSVPLAPDDLAAVLREMGAQAGIDGIPTRLRGPLATLCAAIWRAHQDLLAIGGELPPEDVVEGWLRDSQGDAALLSGPAGRRSALADALENDREPARAAVFYRLQLDIETGLDALRDAMAQPPARPAHWRRDREAQGEAGSRELPAGVLLQAETPAGSIVIAGAGPDTHTDDAFLLIDLGGDDVWRNNAGGSRGGVALAIDLAGDDRYENQEAFTQGSALGGIGVLIDDGGSDTYLAGTGSQGVGVAGFGLLLDRGGSDLYQAAAVAQGVGLFGTGALIDLAGSDRYRAQVVAQGVGLTAGDGVLIDRGGADDYALGDPDAPEPGTGFGQGVGLGYRALRPGRGFAGGFGLLYDREGDDTRTAGRFAQGVGWFGGVGLLVDRRGDDRYRARAASLGHGAHFGSGALLDVAGSDSYQVGLGGQASAGPDGLALLWDRAGDDSYLLLEGGAEAQGFVRGGGALAVFIEEAGVDSYAGSVEVRATGLPAADPGRDPFAVFLDLGGTPAEAPSLASTLRRGEGWSSWEDAVGSGLDLAGPGRAPGLPPPVTPVPRTIAPPELGAQPLLAPAIERPWEPVAWQPLRCSSPAPAGDRPLSIDPAQRQRLAACISGPQAEAAAHALRSLVRAPVAPRWRADRVRAGLRSAYPGVRFAAAEAARRLAPELSPDEREPLLGALSSLGEDEDPRVLREAARARWALGDEEALAAALQTLETRSEDNDPYRPDDGLVAFLARRLPAGGATPDALLEQAPRFSARQIQRLDEVERIGLTEPGRVGRLWREAIEAAAGNRALTQRAARYARLVARMALEDGDGDTAVAWIIEAMQWDARPGDPELLRAARRLSAPPASEPSAPER